MKKGYSIYDCEEYYNKSSTNLVLSGGKKLYNYIKENLYSMCKI